MKTLIDSQSEFDAIVPLFEQFDVVGVDTEFVREKTYSAQLCLVQLGLGDQQYCIDVLAIEDCQALADLLFNPSVLKVLHAASQDLEVLFQRFGQFVKPLFDTQLAAAFAGADLQLGYAALVHQVTGIELEKGHARTDWSRRPLSEDQLQYAAADVAYLRALYEKTQADVEQLGRKGWFDDESAQMTQLDWLDQDPALAYRKLNGSSLKVRDQHRLKRLAQWRERVAQDRNIPRSWVLKDRALYDLIALKPRSVDDILNAQLLGRKSGPRFAPKILSLLTQDVTETTPVWTFREPLTRPQKALVSQLMAELRRIADSMPIATALLGTRRDIEALVRDGHSDKLLSGWRKAVIGEPLLAQLEANT